MVKTTKVDRTDLVFKKIELDENSYMYVAISKDGYPYGSIAYYEPQRGFLFRPREDTLLSAHELELIARFMRDNEQLRAKT